MPRKQVDVRYRAEFALFWACEPGSNPPQWIELYEQLEYGPVDDGTEDNTENVKSLEMDTIDPLKPVVKGVVLDCVMQAWVTVPD